MFEKLKDVLYEISDILLALIIILFMSTVITWKVTDSLACSSDKSSVFNQTEQNKKVEDPAAKTNLPENSEEIDSSTSDANLSQNQDSPQESDNSSSLETSSNTPQPSIVHVEIPNGTSGGGIAKILKDKGLIENTAKFIARVEELKLSSKLKSGSFDIQTGNSLDDVIYIIVGQKK